MLNLARILFFVNKMSLENFGARSIADAAGGAPLEQPSLRLRGKGRVKGGPAFRLLPQDDLGVLDRRRRRRGDAAGGPRRMRSHWIRAMAKVQTTRRSLDNGDIPT